MADEERAKILLGELIWRWRNEAELSQVEAAAAAGITSREWRRVEAGTSFPRKDNLARIVRAARGSMDQAYMLIRSARKWKQEFIEWVQRFQEERIREDSEFQSAPFGPVVHDPDVEVALDFFRRVFPAEADEDRFLFFARAIHQAYWTKQLGGTITVDDIRAEIIPVVMSLADVFERCEGKKAKKLVVYEMVRVAALLMTKPEVADFALYFLQMSFNSIAGGRRDQTQNRRRVERTDAA